MPDNPTQTRWCQAKYCSHQLAGGWLCERHARLLPPVLAARLAALEGTAGGLLGAAPSPEAVAALETLAEAVECCAEAERVTVVNLYRLRSIAVRAILARGDGREPRAGWHAGAGDREAVQARLLPETDDGPGRWGPYAAERGGGR